MSKELKWWNDPKVDRMYAVGQNMKGEAESGQKDGWMLEGIFLSEAEAVDNCTEDYLFVVPIPVGRMTGIEIPDGLFWPRLQTKEDAQERIEKLRLETLEEGK